MAIHDHAPIANLTLEQARVILKDMAYIPDAQIIHACRVIERFGHALEKSYVKALREVLETSR